MHLYSTSLHSKRYQIKLKDIAVIVACAIQDVTTFYNQKNSELVYRMALESGLGQNTCDTIFKTWLLGPAPGLGNPELSPSTALT